MFQLTDIEGLVTKIRHNLPALTYLSLLGNKACPNQLSDLQNDDEDYERYRCLLSNRKMLYLSSFFTQTLCAAPHSASEVFRLKEGE